MTTTTSESMSASSEESENEFSQDWIIFKTALRIEGERKYRYVDDLVRNTIIPAENAARLFNRLIKDRMIKILEKYDEAVLDEMLDELTQQLYLD